MGREIIHKESPDHPGKRSRIWQCEDAWNVLSKQMGTEVVEGLSVDVRASENKLLSTGSFTKMRFLKLLQINGVHLSGPFKLLSEELIWICWLECPLKSFPSDLMLDNLVVLEMQYSNIKELWKEKKILNKLKILNLSYSKNLVKTPNLHSSSLEKLLLEGCLRLVEVHKSVGHLKSLIFLNLKGCRRLKTLPQSICDAKSLEILNISECSQLEKLPKHMGGMESFTELLADGINNEQFLASIEHLKYLRKLSMCGYNFNVDAPSSTSWPHQFHHGFQQELNLSGNNFFSLPSSISVLPKLQLLRVSHCRNLVSISELPSNLKFLDAIGCKSMERYPNGSDTVQKDVHYHFIYLQYSKATQVVGVYCPLSWTRYVSLSEMAMEEYCGHEELELVSSTNPTESQLNTLSRNRFRSPLRHHSLNSITTKLYASGSNLSFLD
uniref:NB-ARC domain-containing protein n=1 Tax=Salix viminalis TaxID=40686 RepID=A0A6N2MJN6_SALVM